MTQPLATFSLTDHETGEPADVHLWSPVAEHHKDDFTDHWRPIFDRHLEEIKSQTGDVGEAVHLRMLQDAHWEWATKANQIEGRLDWTSFAIDGVGCTQGLMFAKTAGFAREPSQRGMPLVEIALLASAPWNRATLVEVPRFKGIGRILLGAAISLSVHEEFAGRVGLHALPQAESWYRETCGMTDLGIDGTEMRYFEMTEAQAQAFLKL